MRSLLGNFKERVYRGCYRHHTYSVHPHCQNCEVNAKAEMVECILLMARHIEELEQKLEEKL